MNIRKKSELIYSTIYLEAWASAIGAQSQLIRELHIQAGKLSRLCWRWDHEFLFRFESMKRARRMQAKNDRQINPQYQKVLSLVEMVAQEEAARKGIGALTKAQVRERVYGADGLIPRAMAYAEEHAVK